MGKAAQAEFGAFLPIANGGWIISDNIPPLDGLDLDGLWRQNLAAAEAAEAAGLDFIMSMAKWRGFGGSTDHWGVQLESLTLMAALSQATRRVKLWTTLHPLLFNPAVAAKMIATLDHVSGGRAGMNVVAGAFREEFEQMGAWDANLSHDDRYDLAEEWTALVDRLWREPSVTAQGRFFSLRDCRSNPKPLTRPRPPVICAGMSERGLEFSARCADACFIGGATQEARRDASLRAKAAAARHGREIKTYAMCTLVLAETDARAQALADRYEAGADFSAVKEMLRHWGAPGEELDANARRHGAFMTQTAIGAPGTVAQELAAFIDSCELDGVMLIFPDYVEGLAAFAADIWPRIKAGAA